MEYDSKPNFKLYLRLKKRFIKGKAPSLSEINSLQSLIILLCLLLGLSTNLVNLLPVIKRETGFIIKHLNWTHDQKMELKVGKDYLDEARIVNNVVPQGSVMMIPPQMGGWSQSGNPEFSQYFYFPAKLVRHDLKNLNIGGKVTHLLIVWGEGPTEGLKLNGWPRYQAKVAKAWMLPLTKEYYIGLPPNSDLLKFSDQSKSDRQVAFSNQEVLDGVSTEHLRVTYTDTDSDYLWFNSVPQGSSIPIWVVNNTSLPHGQTFNSTQSIKLVGLYKGQNNEQYILVIDQTKNVDKWDSLDLGKVKSTISLNGKVFTLSQLGLQTNFLPESLYELKGGVAQLVRSNLPDKLNPRTSEDFLYIGNLESEKNNRDAAIEDYQQSALLDPSNPWPIYWISELYSDQPQKQLDYLQQAYALAPHNPWVLYKLGIWYKNNNQLDTALTYLNQSIDIESANSWSLLARGEIYQQQGNWDLSLIDYQAAGSDNRYQYDADAKEAWNKKDALMAQIKSQISSLEKETKDDPNNVVKLERLAALYEYAGDDQKFSILLKNLTSRNDVNVTALLSNLPPVVIDTFDDVNQKPEYASYFLKNGVRGKAVSLHDYQSIQYPIEKFPLKVGTIQFYWKPDSVNKDQMVDLLYQLSNKENRQNGLLVWAGQNYLGYGIYDGKIGKWQILTAPVSQWSDQWYQIDVSYGTNGMQLFINKAMVAQNNLTISPGEVNPIILGQGPLGYGFSQPVEKGVFDELSIYTYQVQEFNR